jgi:hypothetical protein
MALENVPTPFYDHIMLNGPRRDEQIDNMITTVRNIAHAGIPIFGYNWMPSHVWRTPPVPSVPQAPPCADKSRRRQRRLSRLERQAQLLYHHW